VAGDPEVEVYRALREAQNRYTYFLLAAAGAAIALAVNQTQTAELAWSQLPLAAAVVLWGLSFFFGCRHLVYISSNLYANSALFQVARGEHRAAGTHPQMIAETSQVIVQAIESNNRKASRFAKWQFELLVAGAIAYVVWHVLEMYLRTK
jgi:hypothetical protein